VGGVTDAEVLLAALLHDTVEDTDTTLEELASHFGPAVAALVREVTDDKQLQKEERKARQVEHASELTPRARLIKLADKSCNVRDITTNPPVGWSVVRRREYFDWTRRVVDQIRGSNAALEAHYDETLAHAYEALDALEALES
jgi:GTP diphosphokinase / guanosine-3',5'-bis(diphosphate) 3'-diphosphatase